MKVFIYILQVLVGAVFIFSGIAKLFPIEPFELNFVSEGIIGWDAAPFLARTIIGVEIFTGILFLTNIARKLAAFLSFSMLIFFSLYLVYAIFTTGNEDNCGCFGTLLEMTPSESIIKNIVLLIFTFIISKNHLNTLKWLSYRLVPVFVFAISMTLPYIINPIHLDISKNHAASEINYPFNYELLEAYTDVDYSEGKHIVCFMSLTCPHCIIAAQKLEVLKQRVDFPPIMIYFIGNEKHLDNFFTKSKSYFDYRFFRDENFFKLSGPALPSIQYIENGIVKGKWGNSTLNEKDFIQLFNKK